MSNLSTIRVYTGVNGRQYYMIGNSLVAYDIAFPLHIAMRVSYPNPYELNDFGRFLYNKNQSHNSLREGHEECRNCKVFASFKNIAISVCGTCHSGYPELACDCTNGVDCQETINEAIQNFENNGFMSLGCNKPNCFHKTYLKDVDFTSFGLSEEHQSEEDEREAYHKFITKGLVSYPTEYDEFQLLKIQQHQDANVDKDYYNIIIDEEFDVTLTLEDLNTYGELNQIPI